MTEQAKQTPEEKTIKELENIGGIKIKPYRRPENLPHEDTSSTQE
jgi:hypothetical protein